MTRTAFALLVIFVSACAQTIPEEQVVDDAIEAIGGAGRLRNVKALTIQGTGTAPNAGQNRTPDDELPVWKVNEYTRRIDLVNWRTRVQQVREAQFLFAGDLVQRQTQGLDGDAAYNVSANGTISRAGAAAARDRRTELLHHPVTFLKTIADADITLSNLRAKAGERLVDIAMPDGGTMTLGIDAATPGVDGGQSEHGRRGNRDPVFRLRRRRRPEAAAAAHDEDGLLPPARSSGGEERG